MHPSLLHRATKRARQSVTRLAAALDRGAMRWVQERAEAARHDRPNDGPSDGATAYQRAAELAEIYGGPALAEPSPFFAPPPAPRLELVRVGDGPQRSAVWDITYPSAYEPYYRAARSQYLGYRENLHCHARWWRPAQGGRRVVVLLHGWRAGAFWMTERMFEVPRWLHAGFDVVAMQLPFHGRRAPDRALAGDVSFPSANLVRTNEAFGHAIFDARALALGLREHVGQVPIGACGASLGGYLAALWASVDPTLAFSVPMIPLTSVAKVMLARSEDSPWRRRLARAGIDEAALDAVFAVHSPLARAPQLPPSRRFVIAGRGDRITGAEHARALIDHWGCQSYWFDGGHLAQVGRRGALRAALTHLRGAGIFGE